MPTADKHRRQYNRNLRLSGESLIKNNYADWHVTVCFYAALHLVDEKLAQLSHNPEKHSVRDRLIRSTLNTTYPDLWAKYVILRNYSMKARYECVCFGKIETKHAEDLLVEIRGMLSQSTSDTETV